ncbi:hypothetical protein [Streptosporangium sp. NPDC048865]|uniref:hypothetical protein n=1 Tax=Streptosporangium sp. NPDC048865 TaxID=3155766 RepID=UPI003439A399
MIGPIMVISPSLPFAATTSPSGDIVVFYVGPEPRMTPEQALAFADVLRDLAAGARRPVLAGAPAGAHRPS